MYTGEMGASNKIVVGKPEEIRPLDGRSRCG
jgi:hypothetical protein